LESMKTREPTGRGTEGPLWRMAVLKEWTLLNTALKPTRLCEMGFCELSTTVLMWGLRYRVTKLV
jgi:hypothetical protein